MQLFLANQFEFDASESLTDVATRMVLWLGGLLGGTQLGVFGFASLGSLYTRHKMMQRWRVEYFRAILRQDVGWFDINNGQRLAGQMGEAMEHLERAFSVPTYQGLMPLGMIIGAGAISFAVAPVLACITFGTALVVVAPASFVLAHTVQARTRLLADAYATAGGYANEVLGAVRTVASFGLERFAVAKYDATLASAEVVAVRVTRRLAFSMACITSFVFYMCAAASAYALSIFGGAIRSTSFRFAVPQATLTWQGAASNAHVEFCVPYACSWYDPFSLVGSFGYNATQAMRYSWASSVAVGCDEGWAPFFASCASGKYLENVFSSFPPGFLPAGLTPDAFAAAGVASPCEGMDYVKVTVAINTVIFSFLILVMVPTSISAVVKGKASAHTCLRLILRTPPIDALSEAGGRPAHVGGLLELRDVHFAYPASPDVQVCRGYSLSVPAGSSCALCGPSGAGKSTIVSLLQRFYDPQGGSVLLDGVDVKTLNVSWLRAQMGLVSQEPVLFQGTVAENIGHGKEGSTQEEIEAAAKLANAHGFIIDLANGYRTQVGVRGGHLSGGQKQRVAIARALVRRPKVLLLDEATSALDNASEKVVQAALDEIMAKQKRTTITIAHRLSTIRNADKIAVVVKGKVTESGSHDELRGSGGMYAELLAAQQQQHHRR